MKEPKEWTRPRLYWTDSGDPDHCPLVIIYPDETRPERTYAGRAGGYFPDLIRNICCWFESRMLGNPEMQRKAMMNYAKKNGFKRYFIGEL